MPDRRPSSGGVYGYATADIFFLESCLMNKVCENGEEIFSLFPGQRWHCQFSPTRFQQLQNLLLSGFVEPPGTTQCRGARP